MKKTILLTLLASVLLLSLVSAMTTELCFDETTIKGTVYLGDNISNIVPNATVMVKCNNNGYEIKTNENGTYQAFFFADYCGYGSTATVTAEKNGLTNTVTDFVDDGYSNDTSIYPVRCGSTLNIGLIDIPLVPEFSLILGGITIVGAMLSFLIIRKR
jgi:hypothetical protein